MNSVAPLAFSLSSLFLVQTEVREARMGNAVLNQVTPDGQTGPPRACVPYPEFEQGLLCGSGGKLIPPRSSLLGTRPAVKQSLLAWPSAHLPGASIGWRAHGSSSAARSEPFLVKADQI